MCHANKGKHSTLLSTGSRGLRPRHHWRWGLRFASKCQKLVGLWAASHFRRTKASCLDEAGYCGLAQRLVEKACSYPSKFGDFSFYPYLLPVPVIFWNAYKILCQRASPDLEFRFQKKNASQISVYETLVYDFQPTYTELLFGSR